MSNDEILGFSIIFATAIIFFIIGRVTGRNKANNSHTKELVRLLSNEVSLLRANKV